MPAAAVTVAQGAGDAGPAKARLQEAQGSTTGGSRLGWGRGMK